MHGQLHVCISKNKLPMDRYFYRLDAHLHQWLSWRSPAERVPSVATALEFSDYNNFMFAFPFETK